MKIVKRSKIIIKGSRENGVFILDGEVVTGEDGVTLKTITDEAKLWHLRL